MLKEAQLQNLYLVDSTQRHLWDEFVATHPAGHLLQCYAWGEFKKLHQWQPLRVAITEQGSERILAGAQILFRQMAGLSVAYIPRGPVVDWSDKRLVNVLLELLRKAARRRRAIYLKIEPNLFDNVTLDKYLTTELSFRPSSESVQPAATIRLDLLQTPAQLLERMKPKTRYNIRLAERRGVTCRLADLSNPADFEAFYRLMEATGQRDSFGIHSANYYRDAWRIFQEASPEGGKGALWLAEFGGEIVAGVMVFVFGAESAYFYGASSNEHRREMPTYLLQWRAIQWAQQQGALWYDFWGIPENIGEDSDEREELEQKNVRDGLWGVYRFKLGFGGEVVRYPGAYDLVYNRPMYLIWQRMRRYRGGIGG
ncbi:peptidoglycan bridge formation glycyltransferase FemA/FemB family protein [Candidatus Chlorohelix sp.]|uniref:lipid II:glycine glycyltransferase FemX n=1 Tax=Candidatus Chlorohelix sp. TaxID=3139201 RepID=UPI00302C3EFD